MSTSGEMNRSRRNFEPRRSKLCTEDSTGKGMGCCHDEMKQVEASGAITIHEPCDPLRMS